MAVRKATSQMDYIHLTDLRGCGTRPIPFINVQRPTASRSFISSSLAHFHFIPYNKSINMDMNNNIVKPDNNKPFHSNGYAEIANANQIGSVTSLSFNQRQAVERNRQIIENYNRSAIGTTYGVMRAKPVSENALNRNSIRQRLTTPQRNMTSAPKRFIEPSGRNYNPYA